MNKPPPSKNKAETTKPVGKHTKKKFGKKGSYEDNRIARDAASAKYFEGENEGERIKIIGCKKFPIHAINEKADMFKRSSAEKLQAKIEKRRRRKLRLQKWKDNNLKKN